MRLFRAAFATLFGLLPVRPSEGELEGVSERVRRSLPSNFAAVAAGGELHIADFGKPQNALMLAASLPWRLFDGMETTRDNVHGELPALLRDAGFEEVCETARYMTLFGTLSLYQAGKRK